MRVTLQSQDFLRQIVSGQNKLRFYQRCSKVYKDQMFGRCQPKARVPRHGKAPMEWIFKVTWGQVQGKGTTTTSKIHPATRSASALATFRHETLKSQSSPIHTFNTIRRVTITRSGRCSACKWHKQSAAPSRQVKSTQPTRSTTSTPIRYDTIRYTKAAHVSRNDDLISARALLPPPLHLTL